MYKDIFESIRNEAEKRNLRERTIQLYCSDVSYFLRWIGKNVSDLTLEDAESFLTAKRLEGRSPETHIRFRCAEVMGMLLPSCKIWVQCCRITSGAPLV